MNSSGPLYSVLVVAFGGLIIGLAFATIRKLLGLAFRQESGSEPSELPLSPLDSVSLPFKDGGSALQYACKFLDCSLLEGSQLPAVVMDARENFGAAPAVQVQENRVQTAVVRVASKDGGFIAMANTAGVEGPALRPGQFVLWQAIEFSQAMASNMEVDDERFAGLASLLER